LLSVSAHEETGAGVHAEEDGATAEAGCDKDTGCPAEDVSNAFGLGVAEEFHRIFPAEFDHFTGGGVDGMDGLLLLGGGLGFSAAAEASDGKNEQWPRGESNGTDYELLPCV